MKSTGIYDSRSGRIIVDTPVKVDAFDESLAWSSDPKYMPYPMATSCTSMSLLGRRSQNSPSTVTTIQGASSWQETTEANWTFHRAHGRPLLHGHFTKLRPRNQRSHVYHYQKSP